MVLSHIIGGLGNQMFQYAAGRSLALTLKQEYRLDLSDFSKYQLHHGYELSRVFNLRVNLAESSNIEEILGWRQSHLMRKILKRPYLAALRGTGYVVEPHMHFWPDFFNLKGQCYLYGYWQSERYFKQHESNIRQDFKFREPLNGRNAEFASEISQKNSVSLHIRRGDYISHAKTSEIMELCSLDYYRAGIQYLAQRIERPEFYIFSDDIDWVKQNLSMNFPCTYLEHNRKTESYRDMQLMSSCRHHVIANSSFSWWGAWLNANPQKIVVAPKNWFRNKINDSDIVPPEWVRL